MKKGTLVFAAIWLALLTAAYEAASIEPAAARGEAATVEVSRPLGAPQAPAVEEPGAPIGIHEAHSDGGYWYYRR